MFLVRVIPNFEPPKFSIKQNHLSMHNCNTSARHTIARGTKGIIFGVLSNIYFYYKQ